MYKQQDINFSTYRKGSKPFGRIIDYCPKCGEKGQKTTFRNRKTHDVEETVYDHKGYVAVLNGIGGLTITEWCIIKEKDNGGEKS